jgi:hypothetical protein
MNYCMRLGVFTAVQMSVFFFQLVMPSGLADSYQRFRGTYCLHLQVFNSMFLRNVGTYLQALVALKP